MNASKTEELLRVAKFGGTSLAFGENVERAAKIVLSKTNRRYVVVSAPGKRFAEDTKITDMLYAAYDAMGEEKAKMLDRIKERFEEIARYLGVDPDLDGIFSRIKEAFENGFGRDYAASRGEYIMGVIFSLYIGYEFIDAADVILFFENGEFDGVGTQNALQDRLSECRCAVIPGFYGRTPSGRIKTFARGGSDITGALVSRAVGADIYENFTDVDGFMMADPSLVDSPDIMEQVTYDQLAALSRMGAVVLHEDSVYPVKLLGIPINIKNTFAPDRMGTLIVSSMDKKAPCITGISGKKGYSSIIVKKNTSSNKGRLLSEVCEVLNGAGVGLEFVLAGINSVYFLVSERELSSCRERVVLEIKARSSPDLVDIKDALALVAIVGEDVCEGALYFKMLSELSKSGILPTVVIKPDGEDCVILGVDEFEYRDTVRHLNKTAKDLNGTEV